MKNPYFSLLRAVWHHGFIWRKKIIGIYLAFIFAQLSLSLSPYAFGRTIDILQNFNDQKLPALIFWLMMGIFVILLFWLFHGPARIIERQIALKIRQAFVIELYEQIRNLPLKWHQDHHSGNTITRINRASAAIHRFSFSQFIYIETIIQFLAAIGFLLWVSLPVGLLSLASSATAFGIVIFFDKKLIPLYDISNEIDNRNGAVFFDYMSNMTTILTLRLGGKSQKNLYERLQEIWPSAKKEFFLNELKWFTLASILNVIQSFILIGYIIYHLKFSGVIMIGTVVMIFRYQGELSQVFRELSLSYSELVQMYTDYNGINSITNDIKAFGQKTLGEIENKNWKNITIKSLYFDHEEGKERGKVFKNLSFSISRKEKIALIGQSGAGKSTLLNLLCGLYTPSRVQLIIDDQEFHTLDPLQTITTLIPQDPEIFENTIGFNITLGLPKDDFMIREAIDLSKFSSVLKTLPEGLNTYIYEKGLNFSVGQKQRLALARGLFAARFSSLILMDEPTSSVDMVTEEEILSGVLKNFASSSFIVSLHRLHLLPLFDRIIMLKEGEIVADGSTSQLLNDQGPVFDLFVSQRKNLIF